MKRYQGYQFKQAVEELTRKVAKEFAVLVNNIRWESSIPTAGTNKWGDIYFSDVADDAVLFDVDVQRYVGFAVHEMLHQKYTDFRVKSDEDYLDQLHNAVEDAWIEHNGIDNNLTGNIEGLLTALLDQMVGEANATVKDWTDPRQYPFIFAVYLRRHLNCYVPVPEGLDPIIYGATDRLSKCESTQDTMKVAKWIMSQLKNLPEKSSQSQPQPGEGQDGQDDQDSQNGKGGGRLPDKPARPGGTARRPDAKNGANNVEPKNKAPKGKGGIGSWSEDATVVDKDRHAKAPWLTQEPSVPARLRYEVKRLFDNSGMEEFQRNRRTGSVNVNALHKVGLTDKLFQRRHANDGIDSAVVVAIDVSGSMFDEGNPNRTFGCSNRIVQAVLAAQALIDTLQKSQVATCVLGFGSGTSVLKPFDTNPVKAKPILQSLRDGGGTNDYFAVRYAHKLLLSRPEQRKIAFVITDGVGRPDYVTRQCESGNKLGVTTIGVGIEMDVSHIYPQSINIKDVSDLGTVSFKQIKLAV